MSAVSRCISFLCYFLFIAQLKSLIFKPGFTPSLSVVIILSDIDNSWNMEHQPADQDKRREGTHSTLNWKTTNPNDEESLPPINWNALQEYAVDLMRAQLHEQAGQQSTITCHMAAEYNMGGLHLVRLLEFNDGIRWVARIQLHECTDDSTKRLLHEVHTLSFLREHSKIPVPEVFGYKPDSSNAIGAPFMIMDFIPGDTAMDAFGGYHNHEGAIPPEHKPKFCRAIAQYQVLQAFDLLQISQLTMK